MQPTSPVTRDREALGRRVREIWIAKVPESIRAKVSSESDGCWEWTGYRERGGYGRVHSGRRLLAHRLIWTLVDGPIPDGLCVCHRCDNPPCVRPDHLFLGTNADNVADKISKGRQPRGEKLAVPLDRHVSRVSPEKLSRGPRHAAIMRAAAARGERHGAAKLAADQVAQIRGADLSRRGATKDLALRFGVSHSTIIRVKNGETWGLK